MKTFFLTLLAAFIFVGTSGAGNLPKLIDVGANSGTVEGRFFRSDEFVSYVHNLIEDYLKN